VSTVIAPRSAERRGDRGVAEIVERELFPEVGADRVYIGGDAAEIAAPPGNQVIINLPIDLVNGSKVTIQTASGSM
jgi:hypothetical protein